MSTLEPSTLLFTCDKPAEQEESDEGVPDGTEAAERALAPFLRLLGAGQTGQHSQGRREGP